MFSAACSGVTECPLSTHCGHSDRIRLMGMARTALLALAAMVLTPEPLLARSYLASITGIELRKDEAVESFVVRTWGVEFKAVCRIPDDWEITAGRFGPGGRIAGQSGHGATMLRDPRKELRGLVLIEFSGPVQHPARGPVPATFSGDISLYVGRRDRTRKVPVTSANVRLTSANSCPPVS